MRLNDALLLRPVQKRWVCVRCTETTVTSDERPHTPFHSCRGMKGLTTPFVEEGTKAKIEAREREDYINGDLVQTDGDGRPIMNIQTVRDDGEDCTVFAPCATVGND